uniref:Putative secreted protein n=1 Tax=Panstrongylus lignarius TaxID=156445 RepID=A0A224Y3Z9_9HEMI
MSKSQKNFLFLYIIWEFLTVILAKWSISKIFFLTQRSLLFFNLVVLARSGRTYTPVPRNLLAFFKTNFACSTDRN